MVETKYALVTGASSGIGYELCVALSRRGYKVFGCALENTLWSLEALKDKGVVAYGCDISNKEDIKKAAKFIGERTGGKLDILYNNAGVNRGGPLIEQDDSEVEKLFNVNVLGHIFMTKYMADYVIAAQGTIVFTSSVAARVPLPWTGNYCATKSAIDAYAKSLHEELKPFGVRVHSVITGGVDTAICDNISPDSYDMGKYDVDGFYESVKASANMSRYKWTNVSPAKYSEQVVSKITQRCNPGFNIYKGYFGYVLHLLGKYAPLFITQWLLAFHFKQLKVLSNLRKRTKEQRSKNKTE